ncbi:YbaL family putative K(+) efflux transporter [Rhizorhabdus dicambivorans]|uniref:Kef family K(+) transporter n=1 Tax=Rhizorhabdus dicambivorans TaxID=1850238 RepID=A0A2A4FW08_9SPHN|nr:YbaL family putative K(+) efflux transporter [Rhizorhabdus dicambivorans]ATE65290.1 Kef family K(+) transporter [Rhizorhabdus dicambivorans]PCE42384.1 Kef family K(+) transporter [Rhizorhabdus dicambivorans]
MPHATPLIATIVAGLTLAFLFGALAHRLRLPPLVGYLMAGVAVGPFTPGYVADQHLADQLAELGVILLMFGVGLHFSVRDLMAVRRIAIPGAIVQIAVAVLMGMGLAALLGWSLAGGFVFGLALSVASTVVLLRALQERKILDTERGKIAVGWLIVEDLAMVLALVLLPALAQGEGGGPALGTVLALTVGKVVAFVAFMLIVGRRFIPWLLHVVVHTGSRELFRLSVLAIALGVAFGAAMLFGVSFALGAFFAGMILAESPLSQRAAHETLPLRDAFAVLFFVSVGMLFNPHVVTEAPLPVLATVAIIVLGKSVAAWSIVIAFRHSGKTALTIAASLAQIGEFSFILATMGYELKLFPAMGRDLVLAGAIISILLNPLLFSIIHRLGRKYLPAADAVTEHVLDQRKGHVVVVGYGRVGSRVGEKLLEAGERVTIIETERDAAGLPVHPSATVLVGNACEAEQLEKAGLEEARLICVAIPEGFEAGRIIEQARKANPAIRIVARAQDEAEVDHFARMGADLSIIGEREIARTMIDDALKKR